MQIALQEPHRQYKLLQKKFIHCALSAFESGQWLFGKRVLEFETAFATYVGTDHAISVGNGTDALEIALIAAGAKGKEVITVANAGGYTTSACRSIGAVPVYVDVDPKNLLISLTGLLKAITPETAGWMRSRQRF